MHEADDRKKLFFLSQKKKLKLISSSLCNVLLIFRFDLQSVQLKSKCSVAYHSAQKLSDAQSLLSFDFIEIYERFKLNYTSNVL